MVDIDEYIANRISELLLKRGYSHKSFSTKCGFADSYINNVCNGRSKPSAKRLMIICDNLDITLSDFYNVEFSSNSSAEALYRNLDKLMDRQEDIDLLVAVTNNMNKQTYDAWITIIRNIFESGKT